VAHRQRVLQVEHGLLPVRVARSGPGAEPDGLVAAPELDVEVADERVDEVVAAGGQLEGRLRGQTRWRRSEFVYLAAYGRMVMLRSVRQPEILLIV